MSIETGHVRVLLADDTLIARKGWRAILEDVADIEVAGEVAAVEGIYRAVATLRPTIILLDLKWLWDTNRALALVRSLTVDFPETKILAISAEPELLQTARRLGAQGTMTKHFDAQQLIDAIHGLACDPQVRLSNTPDPREVVIQGFVAQLETFRPSSIADARPYELFVAAVLEFLFVEHLTDFKKQNRHNKGRSRWDLVAFNKSTDPFWTTLRVHHAAGEVIFEVKNVRELRTEHLLQLEDYLREPIFNLGVLMTRNPPSRAVRDKARDIWKDRRKVVLIVADEDILVMLRGIAVGEDPTSRIKALYQDLVRGP